MRNTKSYHELILLPTFKERFDYLKQSAVVADATFGPFRVVNQDFYKSKEWKEVRRQVLLRDNACDLGVANRILYGRAIVHHINPISLEDFDSHSSLLLDPDNLITTCECTHNAIHFGDFELIPKDYEPRRPNDTCPWKL